MCQFDNRPIYYVYAYLDPRKPGKFIYEKNGERIDYTFNFEPFYIGAGKRKRCLAHLNIAKKSNAINTYKINKIRNILKSGLPPIIVILHKNHTQFMAFQIIEKFYIKTIGRKDLGTGPLLNRADGGEGTENHRNPNKGKALEEIFGEDRALEIKKKWRLTFRTNYKKENHPLYGSHHTDKTKTKIGNRYYPKGNKHPRYGISNYETWINKYGKDEADKRLQDCKKQCSERIKGEGNPSYGKRGQNSFTFGKHWSYSAATKQKFKDAAQKRNSKKLECVYCGKIMDPSNFKRYHNDNCVFKPGNDKNRFKRSSS